MNPCQFLFYTGPYKNNLRVHISFIIGNLTFHLCAYYIPRFFKVRLSCFICLALSLVIPLFLIILFRALVDCITSSWSENPTSSLLLMGYCSFKKNKAK